MDLIARVFRSKGVVRLLSVPAIIVVVLFFVVPCIVLILDSFGWPEWTLAG